MKSQPISRERSLLAPSEPIQVGNTFSPEYAITYDITAPWLIGATVVEKIYSAKVLLVSLATYGLTTFTPAY